jgi:hypothetical protein
MQINNPEIKVGKGELIRKLSAIVGIVVFPPAVVAALLELGAGDEPRRCQGLAFTDAYRPVTGKVRMGPARSISPA